MSDDNFARLRALADIGIVIVADIRAATPDVTIQGQLETLTKDVVLNARGTEDCLINWLENSVGVENFSTIRVNAEDDGELDILSDYPNGTAVSVLHNGAKFTALLVHTAAELAEADLKQAMSFLLLIANAQPIPEIATLGPRELAYLKKVSEGETDEDIAKDLNLSMRSVKERKKRTITELGVSTISLAIIMAKKSGQL